MFKKCDISKKPQMKISSESKVKQFFCLSVVILSVKHSESSQISRVVAYHIEIQVFSFVRMLFINLYKNSWN